MSPDKLRLHRQRNTDRRESGCWWVTAWRLPHLYTWWMQHTSFITAHGRCCGIFRALEIQWLLLKQYSDDNQEEEPSHRKEGAAFCTYNGQNSINHGMDERKIVRRRCIPETTTPNNIRLWSLSSLTCDQWTHFSRKNLLEISCWSKHGKSDWSWPRFTAWNIQNCAILLEISWKFWYFAEDMIQISLVSYSTFLLRWICVTDT